MGWQFGMLEEDTLEHTNVKYILLHIVVNMQNIV
jgi:hypothetical protein